MSIDPPLKVLIVGDGAVGKTCLLTTYNTVDDEEVTMTIWDTAGQEAYDRCRVMSYPNTDVFILCFALDNPTSLLNASMKWIQELREFSTHIPILLVGTKADLQRNAPTPVKSSEAKKLAHSQKLSGYVECSAYTQEGVEDVFINAIKATRTYHKSSCCPIC
ncbi:rho-related GTP-binding protein RhoC-like isoform X2 [Oratosquilla oratoria]|uniref:rho-related GTP-binding protein RhoC-like isoform X2 n=1 Tax=Oratosquilla oratoria TaxID=337810 RepID=UPI003F773DEF